MVIAFTDEAYSHLVFFYLRFKGVDTSGSSGSVWGVSPPCNVVTGWAISLYAIIILFHFGGNDFFVWFR